MKKALFTLAIAAAAVSASAQAPTTFNFQGVVEEKSQEIEVVFEVADLDGTVVYTQDPQTVTTNASGAFTAVIGDAAWFIDWSEAYTVTVKVNGEEIATVPFQAVPYANYAATYAGADYVEQSILELTEGNREIRTAIAELREDVDGIDLWTDEFYRGEYADAMREIADQLQVLQEGLSVSEDDIRELSLGTKGEIANIYSLFGEAIVDGETSVAEYLESIMETMDSQDQASYKAIMAAQDDIAALQEAVAIVSDDLQGLVENSRNYASVADVVALQEAMDYVSSDVQGIMEWKSRLGGVNEAQITEIEAQIQAIWLAINKLQK